MPRGITEVDKMIYKGTEDEFIVIVDSLEDLEKWKTDSTVPMARVVGSFNVFTTFREGETGQLNVAPKWELENEFGTSNTETIIKKILLEGYLEKTMNPERQGNRNVTRGTLIPH